MMYRFETDDRKTYLIDAANLAQAWQFFYSVRPDAGHVDCFNDASGLHVADSTGYPSPALKADPVETWPAREVASNQGAGPQNFKAALIEACAAVADRQAAQDRRVADALIGTARCHSLACAATAERIAAGVRLLACQHRPLENDQPHREYPSWKDGAPKAPGLYLVRYANKDEAVARLAVNDYEGRPGQYLAFKSEGYSYDTTCPDWRSTFESIAAHLGPLPEDGR